MTEQWSLDDVLDALMLEEPKPSYEALLRWCEKYPQYRKDLADYFATWAMQEFYEQVLPEPEIDDDQLAEAGVSYGLRLLRQQGRIAPEVEIKPLKAFDQLVLTAVYLLHGKGDAWAVNEKVSEMSGNAVMVASTFESLEQLQISQLISFWESDPATEPEGESNKYYVITLPGERALAEAKATSKALGDFLGDFA